MPLLPLVQGHPTTTRTTTRKDDAGAGGPSPSRGEADRRVRRSLGARATPVRAYGVRLPPGPRAAGRVPVAPAALARLGNVPAPPAVPGAAGDPRLRTFVDRPACGGHTSELQSRRDLVCRLLLE